MAAGRIYVECRPWRGREWRGAKTVAWQELLAGKVARGGGVIGGEQERWSGGACWGV